MNARSIYIGEVRSWWTFRRWLCDKGLHWPVRWSSAATPASYDPPMPPEPGFACYWCGKEMEPYRHVWWDIKRRWYRWRGAA